MIRWGGIFLSLLALSCSDGVSRTQVMLTVDSNLAVPEQIDTLILSVEGPEGEKPDATAMLGGGEPGLPRTLALVHEAGPLGPFTVTVTGRSSGEMVTDVVSRQARFAFQEGRTLLLALNLVASCVEVTCEADESCGESGCRAVRIEPDEFVEWSGDAPRVAEGGIRMPDAGVDSGMPEGGLDGAMQDSSTPDSGADAGVDACVPTMEICNDEDDNCNGEKDEDFDKRTSLLHCGVCNNPCSAETAICSAGDCQDCPSDSLDCNRDSSDGCETAFSNSNCGSCGNVCRGNRACVNGSCKKM